MVSGTFVLTDTMQKAFDGIFDGVVRRAPTRSSAARRSSRTPRRQRATVPASLLEQGPGAARGRRRRRHGRPRRVQRRRAVRPRRQDHRPPGRELGVGIDAATPQLQPAQAQAGRRGRTGAGEIVARRRHAPKERYEVGDTIVVADAGPQHVHDHRHRRRTATVDSLGGATLAVFDLPTAQTLFDKEGHYDSISVAAEGRASRRPQLVTRRQAAAARQRSRSRRGDAGRRRRQGHQRGPEASSATSCSASAASRCSSARS